MYTKVPVCRKADLISNISEMNHCALYVTKTNKNSRIVYELWL